MAGNSALQEKLRQGIEAARKGDKPTAQKLLRQVTSGDPDNEIAWMWLASVSETLQERRACLEQTLRINPNNTRAQQALDQLSSVMGVPPRAGGRRAAAPARRPAVPAAVRGVREGGLNPGYIIVGVLALLALVTALIFSSIASSQPGPPNEATLEAVAAQRFTATPTPTINPADYTPTPFFGIIVTPANLATLPPSFTPTFTPTATFTPPPTQTPFPLSQFSLLYTSQTSLFRSNGDGTGEIEIGGSAGFADAIYDATGENIAFARALVPGEGEEGAAVTELFIARADNPDAARQITDLGSGKLENPSFAPDGIQIVFVSDANGNDDLWYITEDGNNLRPLTTNPGVDKDPAWSPNGDVILYASDQANRSVVTIPAAAGEEGAEGGGTRIVPADPGLTEIFSITPDGETIVQLTDAAGSSHSPAWSPTGERIAFVSDRNGDSDIFIMDADGTRPFLLTVDDNQAEDRNPVFTPDGKSVIFLSNREGDTFQLYSVDIATLVVTRLTDSIRDIESLVFRPVPLAAFASSS